MKYKLLIWDFDGTLADTLNLALAVFNRLALSYGFSPVDDALAVRDMNMLDFLKAHHVPLHRVPLAFAAFLKELKAASGTIRLHDGIAAFITETSARGIRHAVVSSNSTDTIRSCLQTHQVEQHFAFISGMSRILGKERRIKVALKNLHVNAVDALYIGDEIRDINAARDAGMDIAAVTWGLNSSDALRSNAPRFLIDHPQELLNFLT